jgi:predicted dehydrogenase
MIISVALFSFVFSCSNFRMKDKVRIGIIGTGFAKLVQIPAFRSIDGAEVVSVASGHKENAEKVARNFNIPHFTGDWRETIEHKKVDLVCITTPPVYHREMTLNALEHNKHVLCEKPMAMNAGEALEMWKEAKEKNVLSLIDHELRFLSGRRIAYEMIRKGQVGLIRHVKYNFRAPHRGDPTLPWTWWSNKDCGGGALGAIGSHAFDTLRWLSGAEISSVFCQLQSHVKKRKDAKTSEMRTVTTDDEANLILRFADGDLVKDATANVSLSMVEYPTYQNRVEIFGTKGAIRIEFDGQLFIGNIEKETWEKYDMDLDTAMEGIRNTGWNSGFLIFARKIVKALREGKTNVENAATFGDGYKNQIVLDAAHKSNDSGQLIKLA